MAAVADLMHRKHITNKGWYILLHKILQFSLELLLFDYSENYVAISLCW
jgi:hypothetical protein